MIESRADRGFRSVLLITIFLQRIFYGFKISYYFEFLMKLGQIMLSVTKSSEASKQRRANNSSMPQNSSFRPFKLGNIEFVPSLKQDSRPQQEAVDVSLTGQQSNDGRFQAVRRTFTPHFQSRYFRTKYVVLQICVEHFMHPLRKGTYKNYRKL